MPQARGLRGEFADDERATHIAKRWAGGQLAMLGWRENMASCATGSSSSGTSAMRPRKVTLAQVGSCEGDDGGGGGWRQRRVGEIGDR